MRSSDRPRGARKRILLVDDHPLIREGLRKVISRQPDLLVCGDAKTAPEGLAAIDRENPDAVIIDLSLEQGSGLDMIKDLRVRFPALSILVLSIHHEDLYAERALCAGANGYVMKRDPPEKVVQALRDILNGRTAVSENIIRHIIDHNLRGMPPTTQSPAGSLSDREIEIYRMLGEGIGTREIAAKLRLAVSTVESYRANLKQKLNLRNATELVASATRFVASEAHY